MKNLSFSILVLASALMPFTTNVQFSDSMAVDNNYGSEAPETFTGDFTYERLSLRERKPIPYEHLREADVSYATRFERIMDTREKQNLPCRWPKNALAQVVFEAAERGELPAYRNDSFMQVYRADTAVKRLGKTIITKSHIPSIQMSGLIHPYSSLLWLKMWCVGKYLKTGCLTKKVANWCRASLVLRPCTTSPLMAK